MAILDIFSMKGETEGIMRGFEHGTIILICCVVGYASSLFIKELMLPEENRYNLISESDFTTQKFFSELSNLSSQRIELALNILQKLSKRPLEDSFKVSIDKYSDYFKSTPKFSKFLLFHKKPNLEKLDSRIYNRIYLYLKSLQTPIET